MQKPFHKLFFSAKKELMYHKDQNSGISKSYDRESLVHKHGSVQLI
jgi:hypothetical protein